MSGQFSIRGIGNWHISAEGHEQDTVTSFMHINYRYAGQCCLLPQAILSMAVLMEQDPVKSSSTQNLNIVSEYLTDTLISGDTDIRHNCQALFSLKNKKKIYTSQILFIPSVSNLGNRIISYCATSSDARHHRNIANMPSGD